jgi:hypothetical protein
MRKAFDPQRFRWPTPWAALTTDIDPLAFWRQLFPDVAPTVREELRREIGSPNHPLAGLDCRPVAYRQAGCKDYLFLTEHPDTPVVTVHFTWIRESRASWPAIRVFADLQEFVRRERNWVVEIRQVVWNCWRSMNIGASRTRFFPPVPPVRPA